MYGIYSTTNEINQDKFITKLLPYCTSCQYLALSPDLPHFFTTPFGSGKTEVYTLHDRCQVEGGGVQFYITYQLFKCFSSLQTFTYGSLPPYIHLSPLTSNTSPSFILLSPFPCKIVKGSLGTRLSNT